MKREQKIQELTEHMLDVVRSNADITRPEFAKSFATIAVNARLKNTFKKTYKTWEKLNIDLDDYLGLEPVEIDEELYHYLIGVVCPEFQSNHVKYGVVGQTGEPNDSVDQYYYHSTVNRVNGKCFYLGILPSFNGKYKS